MIQKMLKQKKCKVCRCKFQPRSSLQVVCTPQCAYKWVKIKAEGVQRKKDAKRKIELKSKSQWLKEAQKQFNRYIRLRDELKTCISCGRHHKGQYHAGHFLTVKARPDLRFNEDNCHKQCSACNNYLSGNQLKYRVRLIRKIGLERVEALEFHGPALNLIVQDIQAIKETYRIKANELQKQIKEANQC
jgi:hypothetical protein